MLFIPTVFEHAAALIGRTPSEVARSSTLMSDAHMRAHELYQHDAIVVGIDVYNVEAEALGCNVRFFEEEDLPGLEGPIVNSAKDLGELTIPDPDISGRMPVYIDAAVKVKDHIPNVPVGIGVSGPFSLAVSIRGADRIFMDMIDDRTFFDELMEVSCETIQSYAAAIVREGLSVGINESWAAPPMVSPTMYREIILPYEVRVVEHLKSQGASSVALIIGGNTDDIFDDEIDSGANLLIADYAADQRTMIAKAAEEGMALRCNIDPKLVESGPIQDIEAAATSIMKEAGNHKGISLGTGVVPYATPPEHLIYLREITRS